jgi:hypothetical protein
MIILPAKHSGRGAVVLHKYWQKLHQLILVSSIIQEALVTWNPGSAKQTSDVLQFLFHLG